MRHEFLVPIPSPFFSFLFLTESAAVDFSFFSLIGDKNPFMTFHHRGVKRAFFVKKAGKMPKKGLFPYLQDLSFLLCMNSET